MLTPSTLDIATRYWAVHLGCAPKEFLSQPIQIVTHGPDLADYVGVFALFRENAAIVSLPPNREEALRASLSSRTEPLSPETLAGLLATVTDYVIGPADIAYAIEVEAPTHPALALGPDNLAALRALQQACPPREWEHGGSADEHPCSGVFIDGQLTALAGYEVWGGTIAHIAVVTHPDFRHRGYGRSAVAHLAQRAIRAGLLPQYRTLEANTRSMAIGRDLGFLPYARSMAIRLRP
jgi:GNAT superfamily N-acetyltransferase